MNIYLLELQQLIATGQAKDATSKLIVWLANCKKQHPEGEHEIKKLQGQVLVLSGNLANAERDFLASLINRESHNISVAQVSKGLVNIINDLGKHTVFSTYLDNLEFEAACAKNWALIAEIDETFLWIKKHYKIS